MKAAIPLLFTFPVLLALAPACQRQHRAELRETPSTRVAVMGMIHDRHVDSALWGLDQVEQTIRAFQPDAVLAEIPPDRWERIWTDFTERNVFEDERIRRFPEYTGLILRLSRELGFEVVPCAAWTQALSDERQEKIRAFETETRFAARREEYHRKLDAVAARYSFPVDDAEDPHFIHSPAYDRRIREELSLYDRYLNDWIGAGGWTNVNRAHMQLIGAAIDARPGQRLLVTFGAGHKYWFLEALARRDDVRLLDLRPFLPPVDLAARCTAEVEGIHAFLQEWFRGEGEEDDAAFVRFAGVIADDFEMVDPDGGLLDRAAILERVRSARGSRDDGFRIRIEGFSGEPVGDNRYLAGYEEWQEGGGGRRGIRSTALFRLRGDTPDGVEWLALEEAPISGAGE